MLDEALTPGIDIELVKHRLQVLSIQSLCPCCHCSLHVAAMGLIYLAGVVSGSLASFLLDPGLNLVGGSSGCYALLGAATASLVLNWHEDHAIVIRCRVSHVCSRVV